MATFVPANPNVATDMRFLFEFVGIGVVSAAPIDTIVISGGGSVATVTPVAGFVVTYAAGASLSESLGNTPLGGTFGTIGVTQFGTLSGITTGLFSAIDDGGAFQVLENTDTLNGSTAVDVLVGGFGGNDVFNGNGGGDYFMIGAAAGIPSMTVTGASGQTDIIYVLPNTFAGQNSLDLRGSAISSINSLIFFAGTGGVINASQIGAGLSASAQVGGLNGVAATLSIVKDTPGALDLTGWFVEPHTVVTIFGSASGETIRGSNASDKILPGAGADASFGNGGNDIFYVTTTESEFDTFNGGSGSDSIVISGSGDFVINAFNAVASSIENFYGGNVAVSGNGNANVLDFRGLQTFQSLGGLFAQVKGAGGADSIFAPDMGMSMDGGEGDDLLIGGAGKDRLTGGLGKDILTGGDGTDTFAFFSAAETAKKPVRDVITDFKHGTDKFDFTLFDPNPATTTKIEAFRFAKKEGAIFKGKPAQLIWDQQDKPGKVNDVTVVKGDTDGNFKADFQFALKGLVELTRNDFILKVADLDI